jgi:hypothetical protein
MEAEIVGRTSLSSQDFYRYAIRKHHGQLRHFLLANVSPGYLLEGLWRRRWKSWMTDSRVKNDVEEDGIKGFCSVYGRSTLRLQ